MDFELSDDELALAEGIRRLCTARFPLERVRRAEGSALLDPSAWTELGDAGVFSLRAPDPVGAGLGFAAGVVVFEELGRALVPGPLVASHVAGSRVPGAHESPAPGARESLVPGASEGKVVVGSVRRPKPDAVVPVVVPHLSSLTTLVAVGEDGLAAVDPGALEAHALSRAIDPLTPLWRVGRLPRGEVIGGPEAAARWARDEELLTAALLVGVAGRTTELAVAYAKEREQFGRPIGSFQAVKHLCADMLVRAELARVAVHAAAVTADEPEVGDVDRAVAGAALLAGQAAETNARTCIQVHGGMGFTWEVPAHLYLMRARVLRQSLRSPGAMAELVARRY